MVVNWHSFGYINIYQTERPGEELAAHGITNATAASFFVLPEFARILPAPTL